MTVNWILFLSSFQILGDVQELLKYRVCPRAMEQRFPALPETSLADRSPPRPLDLLHSPIVPSHYIPSPHPFCITMPQSSAWVETPYLSRGHTSHQNSSYGIKFLLYHSPHRPEDWRGNGNQGKQNLCPMNEP